MEKATKSRRWEVRGISDSPLVVFFPTIVQTNMGLLLQGPYRTTPSRDNVPSNDTWNQQLVKQSCDLLIEALHVLRDKGLLSVEALRTLPLDRAKLGPQAMFHPLFEGVRKTLASSDLLPVYRGGFTSSKKARLARGQDLRELLDSEQLGTLLGPPKNLSWLHEDITSDRTPELRRYLMQDLDVPELDAASVVPKITGAFLERQSDHWLLRFYEFLLHQPAMWRQGAMQERPYVRLEGGKHVPAWRGKEPLAFLPTDEPSSFPTVKADIARSPRGREFLEELGVAAPDPVDEVLTYVLPKYRNQSVAIGGEEYGADISRIKAAFETDSNTQRDKLIESLRETPFVMVVDAGDGAKYVSKPADVYIATERIKEIFGGVKDVLLVDNEYECLRGEDTRELLEACGATRYLQPMPIDTDFDFDELRRMRRKAGCESISFKVGIEDSTLRGLDGLLTLLPQLELGDRRNRAVALWDALSDLEDRRGTGIFSGRYSWHYYSPRTATFDAAFVRQLNDAAWVPDEKGDLQKPQFIVFETLAWKPNTFLQSKIRFKAPIIDQLAKEAGIEPGLLDLLKKRGITSEAQLRKLLDLEREIPDDDRPNDVGGALEALGIAGPPTPGVQDPAVDRREPLGGSAAAGTGRDGKMGNGSGSSRLSRERSMGAGTSDRPSTPGSTGGRPFISYVAAHPDEGEADPDGLDEAARMALEEKAIALILSREPEWRRTPTHNPGFDLYKGNEQVCATHWCEVKAMTGHLTDRPVGLSHTQFEWARGHGDAYWLYVVERAGTDEPRLVRIQNPARKVRTFTFDHGWLDIAEVDSEDEPERTDAYGED